MTVKDLVKQLNLNVVTGERGLEAEVKNVYICDLLSWVMSHAQKGDAWITVMTNVNIAAVALLTEVACVIIPEDISIDELTIQKANNEGISLLSSSLTAYQLAVKMNEELRNKND